MRDAGGNLRTLVRIRIRDVPDPVTGIAPLRTIQRIRMRDAGGNLRIVYSPLSITVTPSSVSGYGSSGAVASITTGTATAAGSSGSPPYTYAWTQVGTSGVVWTINAPTSASTTFTAASVGAGAVETATFQCAATDATGNTATVQITAFANNGQPYNPDTSGDSSSGRYSTL